MILTLLILVLVAPFCFVVFVGAPYLPSRKKTIHRALDMLDLNAGETLLDLGAGDGSVLILAAQRGLRAVGYELNPLLWVIAKIRLLPYRRQANIYLADFWTTKWPKETKAVYVFGHTRFMAKLDRKFVRFGQPLKIVSFAFAIPGKKSLKTRDGLSLYKY